MKSATVVYQHVSPQTIAPYTIIAIRQTEAWQNIWTYVIGSRKRDPLKWEKNLHAEGFRISFYKLLQIIWSSFQDQEEVIIIFLKKSTTDY